MQRNPLRQAHDPLYFLRIYKQRRNLMQLEARKQLLRTADVAQAIQGSKRFVELEIAAGRLQAVKLSRKFVRIRPEDLDTYLAKYVVGGETK
jgi:excisionase family DNA binding protein